MTVQQAHITFLNLSLDYLEACDSVVTNYIELVTDAQDKLYNFHAALLGLK